MQYILMPFLFLKETPLSYIDALNVFAVSENDVNELVHGDVFTDQNLGVENSY